MGSALSSGRALGMKGRGSLNREGAGECSSRWGLGQPQPRVEALPVGIPGPSIVGSLEQSEENPCLAVMARSGLCWPFHCRGPAHGTSSFCVITGLQPQPFKWPLTSHL